MITSIISVSTYWASRVPSSLMFQDAEIEQLSPGQHGPDISQSEWGFLPD